MLGYTTPAVGSSLSQCNHMQCRQLFEIIAPDDLPGCLYPGNEAAREMIRRRARFNVTFPSPTNPLGIPESPKDKKRELDRREQDVRQREIARRERRLDDLDAADTGTGTSPSLDDLTAVFGDDVDLSPTPAILQRVDGAMVLPANKLNWIYGLPGTGKSFVGLMVLIEAVLRGGRAIYLDYEDSAKTFHQRAVILGFNPKDYADSFRYIHGGVSDYPVAQAEAMAWFADAPDPEMNSVIIDAAESSGCPSDGAQINDWLAKVVMPWRNVSGVNVLDHIPKSRERADGPIGSQRKTAAIDGIGLLVGRHCWTKTKGGRLTLTNDKDRTGDYGKKQPVATIIGDWEGEGDARGFSFSIVEPSKEDAANDNIGGAILNAVDAAGPAGFTGKSKLQQAVGGNRGAVFTTIDNLVSSGMLTAKRQGQSEVYTLTAEGMQYVD